ncbi:MAG: chorismate synthase [Ruminococcaceae bacterium]|nr:chorismate synthase [Oscillospiraceae bacterium]
MSSTYGEHLKLSIFGQSHGAAIGMTLDGIPAGLPVDMDALQAFLARRAPGQGAYATSRKEADSPEFLAGIVDGFTCGAPIAAIIRNQNTRSGDYEELKEKPRPGHADLTAQIKYGGYQDVAGGGHFSGRLTAPLCIAGGLCKQWLARKGIRIGARLFSVGGIQDAPMDRCDPALDQINPDFPVIDAKIGAQMREAIAAAKAEGDSLGGVIECFVTGLPVGLGDPMFDGLESKLAQIIFGIPAVKGLEFGAGFEAAAMRGSENNDPIVINNDKIVTATNNAGGILGGISNGMPLQLRVAIKPTPSIAKEQLTVSLSKNEQEKLIIQGRHDPCIAPRAVPVVEAAAAIGIFDAYLAYFGNKTEE